MYFEGRADVNGQEHLYIETQGAYAIPTEQNGLKIYSSTQGPTAVQRAVSRVTGIPMHQIEVDVTDSAAASAARKIRRTLGRHCARLGRS